MQTKRVWLAALLILGISGWSWPQHHRGHHVHHHGRLPVYDDSKEATIEGTIDEIVLIERRGCPTCEGGATRLFLSGHDVEIHLGPPAYLESRGCTLKEGDSVRVTGSKLALTDSAVLLAREIHCGGESVDLRDRRGRPRWSRPRR